jgi:hypothetical protein
MVRNENSCYDTKEKTSAGSTDNNADVVGSGGGGVRRHKLGVIGGSVCD